MSILSYILLKIDIEFQRTQKCYRKFVVPIVLKHQTKNEFNNFIVKEATWEFEGNILFVVE